MSILSKHLDPACEELRGGSGQGGEAVKGVYLDWALKAQWGGSRERAASMQACPSAKVLGSVARALHPQGKGRELEQAGGG